MSLSAIASTVLGIQPQPASQTLGKPAPGNVAWLGGGGAAYAGAMSAIPGSGSNILKRMLVFGGAGAALGFGASFFTLPVVGQVAAPIAAAVGGGIGAALGLLTGLIARRNSRAAGLLPMAQKPQNIVPLAGKTYRLGQQGSHVRSTQRSLKRLGLYDGKVTGRLDRKTASAIRRYEIMKGAIPTGTSSPELRMALSQDIRIVSQLA